MEFQINTDLSKDLPKVIDFNFEEQKSWLKERLEHYNNLVVTEDTIREGKADRAALNKLKEAIETRRKEYKKEWNAPLAAFETKVKELVALIDEPISAIDAQVKAFEEQRRQEKQLEINEAYAANVPESLQDIIPLAAIQSDKWLNATTTMKAVLKEIEERVKRTEADMMVLDTVEEEYKAAVRETYIRTLDIAAAMERKKALQAAAEAFRQREEAEANNTPSQPEIAQETPKEPEFEQVNTETEVLHLLRLEFRLTQNQANALKQFLENSGIKYAKI